MTVFKSLIFTGILFTCFSVAAHDKFCEKDDNRRCCFSPTAVGTVNCVAGFKTETKDSIHCEMSRREIPPECKYCKPNTGLKHLCYLVEFAETTEIFLKRPSGKEILETIANRCFDDEACSAHFQCQYECEEPKAPPSSE